MKLSRNNIIPHKYPIIIQFCVFVVLLNYITYSSPIPITRVPEAYRQFQKQKRLSDHRSLEDGSGYGYVFDLQDGIFRPQKVNYLQRPVLRIPVKNVRAVRINSLLGLTPDQRMKRTLEFMFIIASKNPVFEDKEAVMIRELKLLGMGVLVQCEWAIQLPPPFNDKQCTIAELESLINQICTNDVFKGLPICPGDPNQMPLILV